MSLGEREGLIARIRQIRGVPASRQPPAARSSTDSRTHADALEARVAHLEQLVEGLQDSVHREVERHGRLIGELQAQIQPSAMGAALSRDARERGL